MAIFRKPEDVGKKSLSRRCKKLWVGNTSLKGKIVPWLVSVESVSRAGPRAKSFQIRNSAYHGVSWLSAMVPSWSLQLFHPGVCNCSILE